MLLLYRPDTDKDDPEFTEALQQTRNDPELKGWFEQHCAMQKALFTSFDHISVPEGLKEQILSERKAHVGPNAARKATMLVLAAVPILLLITFLVIYSGPGRVADFPTYRQMMAGKVLRYPVMDLETSDLGKIRQYLAKHGGQTDYVLPAALEKTSGTGCKIFAWRGKKVSMVCFNSGRNPTPTKPDLFLFMVDRSAVQEPPSDNGPDLEMASQLATASWTNGQKTYLLAGAGDERFLREFLRP
jgi:hypothetical protein